MLRGEMNMDTERSNFEEYDNPALYDQENEMYKDGLIRMEPF